MTRLVSFWAFVLFAALIALQAFPYTGIFLMLFGAIFFTGIALHVFLIALFAEAVFGRIPRYLALIPVLAYAGYYAVWVWQGVEIARHAERLRASNPALIYDFNPQLHVLATPNARALVGGYAVPVAYEPSKSQTPERYSAHRLLPREQCQIERDSQNRVNISYIPAHRNVCVARIPEAPTQPVIEFVQGGDNETWKRKWNISEQTLTLRVDGKELGTFRTASVWRLPAFPMMLIGCGLISSKPAWQCDADFMRKHVQLDTVPRNIDRKLYDIPESVMLGIRKYTPGELANFKGFGLNNAAVARIENERQRVDEDILMVLNQIIEGKDTPPPHNMSYSLGLIADRLSPFAGGMAERFISLLELPTKTAVQTEQQVALASGLAVLPPAAFSQVAAKVFAAAERYQANVVSRGNDISNRHPLLYLRLADAGAFTLYFYKQDFLANRFSRSVRFLPVLAICRIGRADAETISTLKQRYLEAKRPDDANYQSAIFVTLIKLGHGSFFDDPAIIPERYREWADAVRQSGGTTEIGPNNCMPRDWPISSYVPPALAGMRSIGRDWAFRTK